LNDCKIVDNGYETESEREIMEGSDEGRWSGERREGLRNITSLAKGREKINTNPPI